MAITKNSKLPALIKHAREVMGLNPPEGATKEDLLALIAENGGEIGDGSSSDKKNENSSVSYTQADIDNPETRGAAVEARAKSKVRLIISESKDTNSTPQVLVVVNGEFTQIQRGVAVTVPYPVYEGLNNAVTIQRTQGKDGEIVEKHVHSEAFTVIKFDVQPGDFED